MINDEDINNEKNKEVIFQFGKTLKFTIESINLTKIMPKFDMYDTGILKQFNSKAEQGDAQAQYYLGAMYDEGDGVAQDYKKAFEYFEKAAKQGYALAQFALGSMYQLGDGVEQDDKKSFEWTQKAAENGIEEAQINLGVMYYEGQFIEADNKKALEW